MNCAKVLFDHQCIHKGGGSGVRCYMESCFSGKLDDQMDATSSGDVGKKVNDMKNKLPDQEGRENKDGIIELIVMKRKMMIKM